jgi:signal transduction histidine kinase
VRFRYVALPPQDGRIIRVALPLIDVDARLHSVRVVLVSAFAAAALAGLLALALIARGLSRPLRDITGAVERVGGADLRAAVPERGTRELVLLASTVNRMRGEIESRIRSLEDERVARDAILSSLDEGVVLFEADGSVVYRNARAAALLADGTAETARALRPASVATYVSAALRSPRSGSAPSIEVRTGTPPRTLLAATVGVGAGGRVLLVLRDVTEAKTLEAVRRDFVANASHELKTPVASIRALAETISMAADDPAALTRFASQLEAEALRLSRIISDLLDLSRLESGATERGDVRLDLLAAEEVERAREVAAAASLALTLRASEPVTVRGSQRDLGLLVRNLVDNALQYTKAGGAVDVSVSTEDGHAVFAVSDTGVGIPARDRRRIFERFYRVDRARSRETGGTGLGLSIVKHVAENHGGSVRVRSELGQGSQFTVELPLAGSGRPDPSEVAPVSSAR